MSLSFLDVTLRRQGALALLTVLIVQWVLSTGVSAQTIIIPSITAGETYDSNVFYTPKSLLGQGQKPEDYITRVIPQINLFRSGSLVSGGLFGGAVVSRYVNNPNLDYTGYNAGGRLDLNGWARSFSQRITTLSVIGTYQFSPASSGGFGATPGGLGTGFGVTNITSPTNAGLITNRVSTQNYTLGITGGYALTQTTSLISSYNYSNVSFGKQSGGVNNQLFGTEGHSVSTTLSTRLTAKDTVGTIATMSHYSQSGSTGGATGSFTNIAEMLNWARLWTKELTTSLGAGGIVTLPVGSDIPGRSVKTQFAPTATARMTYSSFSEGLRAVGSSPSPFDSLPSLAGSLTPGGINAPGGYTATMAYTYSIFPSYAFGSGPMKSHVVGLNATGGITPKLTGQVGMNYAHSSSSGGNSASTFDTVGLTVGGRYLIGPVLASLEYNWLYFANSATQSSLGQVSQSDTAFSKKMVMLTLSYAFTSQSFFRMGGLSSTTTPEPEEGVIAPSGTGTGSGPAGSGSGVLRKE